MHRLLKMFYQIYENNDSTLNLLCRFYGQLSACGTSLYRWNALHGASPFLRDPSSYLRKFWENSERLGRQVQPGIEPGTRR